MTTDRRVALLPNASFFVGPPLARALAERGHDLVIGDPEEGLVADLEAAGATVEVVEGVGDLAEPGAIDRVVEAGLARFGRVDSAAMFSGMIVIGRFTKSSLDDLRLVTRGCLEAPYHFLKAALAPMIEAGEGQVLLITSAAGARPTPGAPLYSSVRAGANMLARNVAMEVARHGVQVNAVGTNFMDFPAFRAANRIEDDESLAKVTSMVPLGRLGTLDEFASFCMPFVDGTSRFTTGQFVAYAGGWA